MTSQTHSHSFGQHEIRRGERRTLVVALLTLTMMAAEVALGILFGSMALLADGLHMASHTTALGISWGAYVLARRFASDSRLSFGSGKMNSLAAYTSALLLGMMAAVMVWQSAVRMLHPVTIAFDQATAVAVIGLAVNLASAWLLRDVHEHDHIHHHELGEHSHVRHRDQNLRSAYLHVIADAATSVLAIVALLGGKHLGWIWLDPLMGIAGAVLVGRWAWGLIRESGETLLDRQAPEHTLELIRQALTADGQTRITDLHVWTIGPGLLAGAISVAAPQDVSPDTCRSRLPKGLGLVHVTVEVTRS